MIIYRSSDAGAPPGSPGVGGLVNVLTGCLVTGYGSKNASGWQSLSQSGNRLMLSPATLPDRQSYSFVVDDTRSGYAMVYGGVDPDPSNWIVHERFPDIELFGAASVGVVVRRSSTWVVAADQYSCIYIGDGVESRGGKRLCSLLFIGHLKSVDPSDAYTGAVVGESDDPSYGSTSLGFYMHRTRNRSVRSLAASYWRPTDLPASDTFWSVPFASMYEMRYIRGLYVLLRSANLVGYDSGTAFNGTGVLSGKTFELYWTVANDGVLIQTTEWEGM